MQTALQFLSRVICIMMVMMLGVSDGGHIITNRLELLKMIKNDEDFTPVAREVSA